MKKQICFVSVIALLIGSRVNAEPAKAPANAGLEDNAIEIYEVKTKEGDQNPYIQVPITHEMFSFSRKTDLSDLIAVDASKHLLPLRLVTITPTAEVSDEEIARSNLPFIPVAADLSADALRVLWITQVTTTKEAATKETGTKEKSTKSKNKITTQVQNQIQELNQKTPEFYLVDLKNLEQDSNQLEITWTPAAQAEYVEIEIEATRNLEDWESMGRKMLVQAISTRSDNSERSFLENRIALNLAQNEYDYLRVKVVRGGEFFKLTSVQAIQIKKQTHRLKPKQETWAVDGIESTQLNGVSHANESSLPVAAWEYVRNESTPAESLSLDMNDLSYADSISLFSRISDKQPWQLIYQGPWIHVQVGNEWQTGNSISLYNNQHKYWRLEMNQSLRGLPAPKFNFVWQPYQLQIIASNRPPFLLAINMQAASKKPTDQIFNQLLEKANPVWSQADLVSLNIDPEYTQQSSSQVSSWRQWLFWLCLIVAVTVLLIFSWKLINELKQNPLSTGEQGNQS